MTGPRPARVMSVLGAAAALAAACGGDSTGPAPDVTVTITVTQLTGPDISDLGAGQQRVQCGIALSASATGSGTARATWRDATLLFYAGPARATPVDSALIPMSEIQTSWGASDIGPGDTQQSGWRISAAIPFGAALVYRYQPPTGGVRSTSVTFTCGPEIANPQPPTISGLSVQPAGSQIEPGGTLIVHYIAESDVGLWTSSVKTSGACTLEQAFSERLLRSSDRTVSLVIPGTCTLGKSLSFQVIATDAVLQSTTVLSPRSFTVVDRTPPQVLGDHWPTATDYYFVGDTLRPFVWAQDNQAVRSIIWEVQPGGLRDSISGAGGRFVDIPIRPEWAGASIQIRLFARDMSGLVSDTLVAPIPGLPIYPTVQRPTRWTTIAGDVEDLAFDSKRGMLYLVQAEGSVRIGVFSLANLAMGESIPLRTGASDLDLTPGDDSLVLVLPYERALGIIDLLQASPRTVTVLPLHSLDTTTQQAPWQVRVGANGKAYVILEGPTSTPSGLLEVDLATGTERLVPGSANIAGVRFERSFDRTALIFDRWTDLLERYDVTLDAFGPLHAARSIYGPLRVDGSGARVTIGLDIYDPNLDFLRRLPSVYGGDAVPGAALSKDGMYLYSVLGFRGIARTRTSDGAVLDRWPTPFSASGYLRVSPDGSTLIVVDSFAGTARIALIDLR